MNSGSAAHIITFGCQMNVHDSERIARLLSLSGFRITSDRKEADLIILNTCTVREKAEQKVYSELGRLGRLKKKRPWMMIGVGGCVAQQEGEALFERSEHLDFLFGTHSINRIPELIREIQEGSRKRSCLDPPPQEALSLNLPQGPPQKDRVKAYVTIMQGCNNFCSYCIVPYVRGPEISRPPEDIIAEIEALASEGVKEVTLLGQNVNSYGRGLEKGASFVDLLKRIHDVEGIERIRFTTSHPKDLSPELINALRDLDKLCEHIHLPVQSGSNRILRKMNRGYTREQYLEKVRRLREAVPEIAITADMIVGFPGESDSDFMDTISLVEEVRFDGLFSFKYSARKGIASERLPDKIPEKEKLERLGALQRLQKEITLSKNRMQVGRTEEVLVESTSKRCPDEMTGRTRSNRIVNFPAPSSLVGELVTVRITRGYANSLRGELLRGSHGRDWKMREGQGE